MQKLLIIVGPTGIGKSDLSIKIAQAFSGQIISGDAYQVYRDLNIGTAKLVKKDMEGIKHYCIDEIDLKSEYNVAVFQNLARNAIKEIADQGKVPIICGGTGLYIKAALYDYTFEEVKKDVLYEEKINALSNKEAMQLLKDNDFDACENLHENNRKRVNRALMMAHGGLKKSSVINQQRHIELYDSLIIGLTMERSLLYQAIDERVDKMISAGLLNEVKTLVEIIPDIWSYQSFQGIGYKEWKNYFEGNKSVDEVIIAIKKNSRNFAKKQYTWFNNQMNVNWYDKASETYLEQVYKDIKKWMGGK